MQSGNFHTCGSKMDNRLIAIVGSADEKRSWDPLCNGTPMTCLNDALRKPGFRLIIRRIPSLRPVSRIFWKTMAALKQLYVAPHQAC